jgi:hypothetical protein
VLEGPYALDDIGDDTPICVTRFAIYGMLAVMLIFI